MAVALTAAYEDACGMVSTETRPDALAQLKAFAQ